MKDKKNVLIIASLLLAIVFLFLYLSKDNGNEEISQKNSEIESLKKELATVNTNLQSKQSKLGELEKTLSEYQTKIDTVIAPADSSALKKLKRRNWRLHKKNSTLTSDNTKLTNSLSQANDSIENLVQLTHSTRQLQTDLDNCTETSQKKSNTINSLYGSIAALRSYHELPLLYLLNSAKRFYPSQINIPDDTLQMMFDEVTKYYGWNEPAKSISPLVRNNSRSYKTIKWVGLKGSSWYSAYFFIKRYKEDPKTISEERYKELLKELFEESHTHLKYSRNRLKQAGGSLSQTKVIIDSTINCLTVNLELHKD